MPTYYPVFMELSLRRCVVIGGGKVAERKVETLLECDAAVQVISPEVTPALAALASEGRIRLHRRTYKPGDLQECLLAIAATDDQEVNVAVCEEARARNIPVNVVDQPALCSFIAPSIVRRGDVTIAFSTGGKSPALARKLREDLERLFPPEYGTLLEIVGQVREELRRRGVSPSPEAWQWALGNGVLDLIQQGQFAGATEKLLSALQEKTKA